MQNMDRNEDAVIIPGDHSRSDSGRSYSGRGNSNSHNTFDHEHKSGSKPSTTAVDPNNPESTLSTAEILEQMKALKAQLESFAKLQEELANHKRALEQATAQAVAAAQAVASSSHTSAVPATAAAAARPGQLPPPPPPSSARASQLPPPPPPSSARPGQLPPPPPPSSQRAAAGSNSLGDALAEAAARRAAGGMTRAASISESSSQSSESDFGSIAAAAAAAAKARALRPAGSTQVTTIDNGPAPITRTDIFKQAAARAREMADARARRSAEEAATGPQPLGERKMPPNGTTPSTTTSRSKLSPSKGAFPGLTEGVPETVVQAIRRRYRGGRESFGTWDVAPSDNKENARN